MGKALREVVTPIQGFAKKYKVRGAGHHPLLLGSAAAACVLTPLRERGRARCSRGAASRCLAMQANHSRPPPQVPLYLCNNLQIVIIVWQKLSNAQHALMEQEFVIILLAVAAAIVQHFCFLVLNTLLTWLLRVPQKERQAIIIMASQKNLPVAAVIISYFDPAVVRRPGTPPWRALWLACKTLLRCLRAAAPPRPAAACKARRRRRHRVVLHVVPPARLGS